MPKKNLYNSRKKYLAYFGQALKRSEPWSHESLPIVIVDKSEIKGTRQTSNEPPSDSLKMVGSSESFVLQGEFSDKP